MEITRDLKFYCPGTFPPSFVLYVLIEYQSYAVLRFEKFDEFNYVKTVNVCEIT